MSVIGAKTGRLVHFYRSGPMPCPYIAGRIERKLFTRMTGPDGASLNSILSQAGFRRSHDVVYRPVCPGCNACVPVRIPVERFRPNRTQRRLIKANADLSLAERPPKATAEQYALFGRYQHHRHGDSDMARMSRVDYAAMIEDGAAGAVVYEFRPTGADGRPGPLAAAMLADRLDDGLSAVYSFFDPALDRRSPGTFMILAMVEEARRLGLPHVYLGYWIAESRKMAYKARFRPLEALVDGTWRDLDD
ncbi:MAG: arginyltransferase [Deinococcus-Thermus bacterium]|jgi:arginine-tRNA-protein transferase|nr:arginyltransferase [Deinococcota bacterium]